MIGWLRRLIAQLKPRKDEPFQNAGASCEGLPHVGTLSDGRRVYSKLGVRASSLEEIVFVNGSFIKTTNPKGSQPMTLSGGRVIITDRHGRVQIRSGGGNISISGSNISNSRIDIR